MTDSAEPIDWDLARRVARRIAGRAPGVTAAEHHELEASFADVTPQAEALVAEHTGLVSAAGPARSAIVDRPGWADANVDAFRHLLAPVTTKLGERMGGRSAPLKVARSFTGVEVGALLGWMSARVLGQYDLLLAEAPDNGGVVYYVGPNVVSLERRFGFEPRPFRLWLAVHELTHRAQFTGVPWMRDHYHGLVTELTDSFDPDPERLMAALKDAVSTARTGRSALADGGLAAVLATPEQRAVMARIGGLMSLLEGHGDLAMNRAGEAAIPGSSRFARVLGQRRSSRPAPARILHRLLGLEAKLAQYAEGEAFLAQVEAAAGAHGIDRAWVAPDNLPDLAEIREPQRWLERVGLSAA